MKLLLKKFFLGCLILTITFLFVDSVLAASETVKSVTLENPIKSSGSMTPAGVIGLVIKAALGMVGGLTLVMVVYGGFQWLTAAGNKEKIESGSKTMLWAVIGLIVTLGSYLLVDTIFKFLSRSA